jgi:hypothetical protein
LNEKENAMRTFNLSIVLTILTMGAGAAPGQVVFPDKAVPEPAHARPVVRPLVKTAHDKLVILPWKDHTGGSGQAGSESTRQPRPG